MVAVLWVAACHAGPFAPRSFALGIQAPPCVACTSEHTLNQNRLFRCDASAGGVLAQDILPVVTYSKMKTSTMVAVGVGAAAAAFFLLRPSTRTVMTPVGPITVSSSGAGASLTGERIAAAAGTSRESMIAEWMRRGLTRQAAEARWNLAMAAASGSMRGFGGYV